MIYSFRICSNCNIRKSLDEFTCGKRIVSYCRECRRVKAKEYYKNNPAKFNEYNLKKYGLTIETFKKLFEEQNGMCAICEIIFDEKNSPCIDHSHKNNIIRGLLCQRCNLMIGYARDNIVILKKSIQYLENYELLSLLGLLDAKLPIAKGGINSD